MATTWRGQRTAEEALGHPRHIHAWASRLQLFFWYSSNFGGEGGLSGLNLQEKPNRWIRLEVVSSVAWQDRSANLLEKEKQSQISDFKQTKRMKQSEVELTLVSVWFSRQKACSGKERPWGLPHLWISAVQEVYWHSRSIDIGNNIARKVKQVCGLIKPQSACYCESSPHLQWVIFIHATNLHSLILSCTFLAWSCMKTN